MSKKKHLQTKIATSRYALPFTATLIALIWVAVGVWLSDIWVQLALTAVSTFLMVELNNENALMRTYSRMVSCSFLVLISMAGLPHPPLEGSIVTLCFIAFYLIIWHTYQEKETPGVTYFAFLCIGVASLFFIHILYFVPFLWVLMMVFTLSFSVRNLFASLLALITPYWFAAGYYVYRGDFTDFITHVSAIADYQELFDYSHIVVGDIVNLGFIALLALMGMIHFLRTSYADKIRTRMIYESLILMDFLTMAFIALQPCHLATLGGLMIVNTSPLIAHYITFTRTRLTNISFVVIILAAIAIMCYNIFLPQAVLL